MKKTISLLVIASFLGITSCHKDTNDPTPLPTPTTAIRLSFANVVGSQPLTLSNTYQYVNANNDSFACSLYKYYISNIKFTDSNNNTWSEPESYHLVNAGDPASLSFLVNGIPAATYTSISFMIGVDSAKNVSGSQTGALDPVNDMFWTWNDGYIMAKFEGKSPVSTLSAHIVQLHVGGFSGTQASQRIVSPSFGSNTAIVTTSVIPVVHINSDVLEWFQTPNTINFATTNGIVMPGPQAMMIADNYADMFTVTGITN